jgi:transcriptional regulator with XRE-family HTH domain
MTIGRNLRRLRKDRGLSQLVLSEKSGIAQPSISDVETGRREPHHATLKRLADALGVGVVEFFEEGRPPVPKLPSTPLARSDPEAIETKLFGAPASELEGELGPVLSEPEARSLSDDARRERDALERWMRMYAAAEDEERFSKRAESERAKALLRRARFYHDLLFDYWSKLYDRRGVPFKAAGQFAAEQIEARNLFLSALENETERKRVKQGGQAG